MSTSTAEHLGLVIDGDVVQTPESSAVHDPAAPAEVVGFAASATVEQSTAAVEAAHRAWRSWSAVPPRERADRLLTALEALDTDVEGRAEVLVRENGKPLAEAQVELAVFVRRCQYAATLAPQLEEVRHLPAPPFRSEVHLMPMGVVTIIVPYNWPLAILAASLPYALVAGCTTIVKPPPTTPLSVVRTLQLLAAGLPDGVLNVVTGSNEAVAPLISHPLVRRVVFTGSTGAGRMIMKEAADNITRVTLELGGNDPAILLEDVELDANTVGRLVRDSFTTSGQVCMGIKRVYVHESRYDEVVEAMTGQLAEARVGHGLDPATTMGPLNSQRQRDFVAELVADAQSHGYEARALGTIAEESVAAGGWFHRPTLVLDPDPGARIVREEQFGPALPILRYTDLDQVIDSVNEDWSGLCSSVWTADLDRAAQVASRLRTGTTWVNDANAIAQDDRAPFGGFRQSGMGRELSTEGLLEFTEPHTITYRA